MAANSKKETKENILPHSQAKLDLYKNYLLHYLRVLGLSDFITKINLIDVYCGIGKYKDGKIGSPLITNDCVKIINETIRSLGKKNKPISIVVNDFEKGKINNVISILESNKIENCNYEYYNEHADDMLNIISQKVNSYPKSERNLIFIDPYGYSHIESRKIYNLIKNKHTEIILFLPIMQMYRFAEIALNDPTRACYDDLRKFIFSFFPANHKIHSKKLDSVFEFIKEVKGALSFEKQFYTCSHYIQRDTNNYYALFFISSHIYGLDKMVEAKWKLDPIKGKGFIQEKAPTLFDDHFEEIDKNMALGYLKTCLLKALKIGPLSNTQVYELALINEFKPQHAKETLNELIKNKKVEICNSSGSSISHIGSFGLDFTHFKNKTNKIYFKLR